MNAIDRPLVHPDRQVVGFRPIKALRHFGKLVADKEDTEQVFHIIEALKGKKSLRQMEAFMTTDEAQDLLRRNDDLVTALDDHARWADCPPNSLAQKYIRFMTREGLTAQGLVEESYKFKPKSERFEDLYEWYIERLRDTHDLFHVLTGYGRDALGETCLLGFSYEQNHNPGVLFIAYMGTREIRKECGGSAPVFDALREGRRLGREAKKLAHQDLLSMLPRDIDDVRAGLNLGKPEVYRQCLTQFEADGFGADEVMTGQQQAA